eukprot:649472-Pleurochrysis_carterae.AAC.3
MGGVGSGADSVPDTDGEQGSRYAIHRARSRGGGVVGPAARRGGAGGERCQLAVGCAEQASENAEMNGAASL